MKIAPQADGGPRAAFTTATYMTAAHTIILKVVNANKDPLEVSINLRGAGAVAPMQSRGHRSVQLRKRKVAALNADCLL